MIPMLSRAGRRARPLFVSSHRFLSSTGAGYEPGALWIWGKVEGQKLGMSLPNVTFSAQALTMGPAIGPTHNPGISGVKQVVCCASKTLALTNDGRIYSWGSCENSSLGHGDGVFNVPSPRLIEALKGIKIVQVSEFGGGRWWWWG